MEMLHFDFMRRAFYAGGLIALLASVLGVYLMLRRQALMADTLSHVSLAGVAAGTILQINPTLAGFAVAVAGAAAVEIIRRFYPSYSEMSVAIIMTGGLSTAVVLMSLNQGINKSFSAYLFGSVVAVNQQQLWLMLIVTVVGGVYLWLLRRPLYQMTFDEETARANGLPVQLLSFSFSVLTGMTVAAAMPIVGVLLVSALIVLPAALAIRIAAGFASAVVLSMLFGLTGVYAGLTLAYQLSTPPGGTIALVLLVFLLIGLGAKRGWHQFIKIRKRKSAGQDTALQAGAASRSSQS
ncbi:iron transport protein [Chlamydia abortus]|uniref:Metal ABC transporter permease n=1 Tax=Paenibacillus residui TaxID=629724 RepID=A0ABW3D9Y6_9BACL|nr:MULTISPECIES: metal ABC transporter permease [Paenibacillaceae]SHE10894.1 iron transport protein [Chlamydia abortus]